MRGAGGSGGFRSLRTDTDVQDLVAMAKHLMMLPLGQPLTRGSLAPAEQPSRGYASGEQAHPSGVGDAPQPRPRKLAIVGYSYGTVVASRSLPELCPNVAAFVVVAPPLGTLSRIFLGAGSAWEALTCPAARDLPRLVCCGDRDQFTDIRQLEAAVRAAQAKHADGPVVSGGGGGGADGAATGTASDACAASAAARPQRDTPPCSLDWVRCPGCDHFFFASSDPGAFEAALAAEGEQLGLAGWAPPGGARPSAALARFVALWLLERLKLSSTH